MKNKLLLSLLGGWIVVFVISFFTANENLSITTRLLYTFVLGSIGGLAFCFGFPVGSTEKNAVSANSSNSHKTTPSKNQKITYIFYGAFDRKIAYKIDGYKIYKGSDSKFTYTIKDNKIYEGIGGVPKYRIEKNRIYKNTEIRPLYRIEGNKIYQGEFDKKIVYRISDSSSG